MTSVYAASIGASQVKVGCHPSLDSPATSFLFLRAKQLSALTILTARETDTIPQSYEKPSKSEAGRNVVRKYPVTSIALCENWSVISFDDVGRYT